MGVPAFFRWLSQKFPKIVVDVVESKEEVEGTFVPVDTSAPNPNGVEFDNLYLDMNGIIHPCTHPEGKAAPGSEEEMMLEIMAYIDRLFSMVRPRKLLYMAIDGVAPRAKMNQQRSRRFRSAKEAAEKKLAAENARREAELLGAEVPAVDSSGSGLEFDSNCITPGTDFMDKVAVSIRYYVALRMQTDPGWKGISVIVSDSNVPGEGEHKIMEFIRLQRSQDGYDPNTRHVICGLDADLIMLGLATHEPHFSILRETVTFNNNNNCFVCGQPGHMAYECQGKPKDKDLDMEGKEPKKKPFQFLHLSVLREYLGNMLEVKDLPFEFSLERAIDDWVFLCFFVGNDFLPHLPTLEIRENAIGLLTDIYKKLLPTIGYITDNGEVDLRKLKRLLFEIAQLEDSILVNRLEAERRREERQKRRERNPYTNQFAQGRQSFEEDSSHKRKRGDEDVGRKNMEAAAALRAALQMDFSAPAKKTKTGEGTAQPVRAEEEEGQAEEKEDKEAEDPVRLGESGWKERYYKTKFGVDLTSDRKFVTDFATSYVQGLVWVLRYYYKGCCSWKWYFPYHYAPFASELAALNGVDVNFDLGTPFFPLEQLMGVLPAASSSIVPPSYRHLMSDPDSPVIDFYPEDFKIDKNGKKQAWLGVVLLPFIEEKRLLDALASVQDTLTREEIRRNSVGADILYLHEANPGAQELLPVVQGKSQRVVISPPKNQVFGFAQPFDKNLYRKPYKSPVGAEDILESYVMSVIFYNPKAPPSGILWGLLKGVVLPPRVTTSEDFKPMERPRTQNHAANRMINSQLDSNQYKPIQHRPNRHEDYYHPYKQTNPRFGNQQERPQQERPQQQRYPQQDRYPTQQSQNDRYPTQQSQNDRYPQQSRYPQQDRYQQQERRSQQDRYPTQQSQYQQQDRYPTQQSQYQQQDRYPAQQSQNDRYADRNSQGRQNQGRPVYGGNPHDRRSQDNYAPQAYVNPNHPNARQLPQVSGYSLPQQIVPQQGLYGVQPQVQLPYQQQAFAQNLLGVPSYQYAPSASVPMTGYMSYQQQPSLPVTGYSQGSQIPLVTSYPQQQPLGQAQVNPGMLPTMYYRTQGPQGQYPNSNK